LSEKEQVTQPGANENIFYKNVRDILDEKNAEDTMSSFEDGDAPKGGSHLNQYKKLSMQMEESYIA